MNYCNKAELQHTFGYHLAHEVLHVLSIRGNRLLGSAGLWLVDDCDVCSSSDILNCNDGHFTVFLIYCKVVRIILLIMMCQNQLTAYMN